MNNSYFKTIFYSFYSDKPYLPALKNWRGCGLKYLLLVTAISSLFITIGWIRDVSKTDTAKATDIVMGILIPRSDLSFEENITRAINIFSQIPEIKIEKGVASTSPAQIYSITDPASGHEIAIIDTTGKSKSLDNIDAEILLTDTKLITKNKNKHENVMYISEIEKHYNIDEKTTNDMLFIISQIPNFSFHAGRFETTDNKLHTIYDRKNRELAEIGNGAALGKNIEPMLAISPTEINYKTIFNKQGVTIKAESFNEQMLFDMVHSSIKFIKKCLLLGMIILAFPLVIISSFAFNFIILIFYAFIGHSFIKIMKLGQFEYKDIMRIAVVAITPMLFASAMLPQLIPSQGMVYFLISIGYLYYAIKSVTAWK